MDVVEVLQRVVDVDLDSSDLATVRAGLADSSRVRAWLDAWDVGAKRALDKLQTTGQVARPDAVLARGANVSARRAGQIGNRDRALGEIPPLEDALRDGATTGAHVDTLSNGLSKLEPEARRKLVDAEGDRLARLATEQTPEEYAKTVRESVALAQLDGGLGLLDKQRRAVRCKTWTDPITGMRHIHAEVDPESGLKIDGRLRTVIEQLFHDKLPDTCPSDPFARQDHLRGLAFISIFDGTAEAGSGRPDVIVVVDEETLRSGLHDRSIVDLGNDSILPVETLRRMACLANIIPTVLNSDGVVVDIGRGARLATQVQRRAMRAMYPTCGLPGCRVPFEQCTIHHIRYWESGGTTDMANMLPLCTKHHHCVHEGGWQLHLDPTTRQLTITYPDGTVQTTGPPRARAG